MSVRCEKHQNTTLYSLIQSKNQSTQVSVALVKILVVEVKFKLVSVKITVQNCGKNLTFFNEMLTNELNFKV